MKFECKRKEVKIHIDGEVATIVIPPAKRMYDFGDDIIKIIKGDLKDKTDHDLTMDLLEECGCKREIAEKIDALDLKEIIRILDGQKKI